MIELDTKFCIGKPPLESDPPTGSWVAGGAVRRWFTGESQDSDIDIFTPSDTIQSSAVASLCGETKPKFTSEAAATYEIGGRLIQFINRHFDTPQVCMSAFDFHICQFAWIGGEKILTTPEALVQACRKRLSVNVIQDGFELDSLRRAFKYHENGFTPCLGCIRDLALALRELSEEEITTQERRISPGGARWD